MGNRIEQAIKQQPFAAMSLAILMVASNAVVSKLMFEYFPPLVWGFLRLAVAGAFFTAVAYLKYGPLPAELPRGKVLVVSALSIVNGIAFFIGLELTQAINASILSLLVPIIVYVGSVMFLKEPASNKAIIGSLISIIGGLVLFGAPSLEGDGRTELIGVGLLLIAFISLGASILYTKSLYQTISVEHILGVRSVYAALVIGAIAVVIGDPLYIKALDVSGALIFLFGISIASTIGAYVYYKSLSYMQAEDAATLFYLDPLFAAFLSVLVLGETMSSLGLVASGLIIVGVLIAHPVHIRRMYFYENPALSLFDRLRHWLEDRIDSIAWLVKKFF